MSDMERRESHIELSDKIARLEVCIVRGFAETTATNNNVNRIVEDLKKESEMVIHCLYGNGQEGLTTKVAKIHQKVNILWGLCWVAGTSLTAIMAYFLQDFAIRAI